MTMEERLVQAGIQVNGKFDADRFFQTLARILSLRENLSITVTVHKDGEETQDAELFKTREG
jgi:hypothetical protein